MSDCLFCKIIAGEVPSTKVFENEAVYGFKDLHPSAKHHLLFIHKKHTPNMVEMSESDPSQLADIFQGISQFAKDKDFIEDGFRVVTNCGPNAGQTVFHTHFHVLAGERLKGFGA